MLTYNVADYGVMLSSSKPESVVSRPRATSEMQSSKLWRARRLPVKRHQQQSRRMQKTSRRPKQSLWMIRRKRRRKRTKVRSRKRKLREIPKHLERDYERLVTGPTEISLVGYPCIYLFASFEFVSVMMIALMVISVSGEATIGCI